MRDQEELEDISEEGGASHNSASHGGQYEVVIIMLTCMSARNVNQLTCINTILYAHHATGGRQTS